MRAGRGLQRLDGVGVRVGGAPVTLAVRAGALAALPPVTRTQTGTVAFKLRDHQAARVDRNSCGPTWKYGRYTSRHVTR